MKNILIYTLFSVLLLFSGCSYSSAPQSKAEVAKKEISKAEARYTQAHKAFVAWKDTKKVLKKAKKFYKDKRFDDAIALAKEAYYQANMALIEADEAEKVWRSVVPK